MKLALFLVPLFLFSSAYAGDFPAIQTLNAAAEKAPEAVFSAPVPAVAATEEQVPQDLLNRFNSAANRLRTVEDGLTWVRTDIDTLERTARRLNQTNSTDAFFQMDLRRMASDMARRVDDIRGIAMEVKNLLTLAQKSKELNYAARNIELSARNILNQSWPMLENSAQNLEWTIRSGKPEILGYDAQWTAMDISRHSRDFTYQARDLAYDAQSLVFKTQP
ncbi:MAG: hypothetical protein NDI60_11050 [Elusimicrobiales bacterium]|nr:hypothetical protein [Elusimicrobiales bacterium]